MADDRFDRLVAGAPVLDMSAPEARRMEALAVVENILGSMIGSVRRELAAEAKSKKVKGPTGAGYAKLLLADLSARGWELRETGP